MFRRRPPSFAPDRRATREDVENAYRLFLSRAPNPADWEVWALELEAGTLTLEELTDSFLLAEETEARRAEAAGRRPRLVTLPDFSIYVHVSDKAIGETIAAHGVYEGHVTAELRRRLKPGDTFVDVGANVGFFTLLAASLVGGRGRVVAFEPSRSNAELLRKSLEANPFDNVTLHRTALGCESGAAILVHEPGSSNAILPRSPENDMPAHALREEVSIVRLDDFLPVLPSVEIVKMDVEGFEPQVWDGMTELVARYRPVVLLELSPLALRISSGETAQALLDRVLGAGYELRVLRRVDTGEPERWSGEKILSALPGLGEQGVTHIDIVAVPT